MRKCRGKHLLKVKSPKVCNFKIIMKYIIRAHVPGMALAEVLGQPLACPAGALKGFFPPRKGGLHGALQNAC